MEKTSNFNYTGNIVFPNLELKIKRLHPDAVIPSYAKNGDAGMDLTAISKELDNDGNMVYDTGLAFEIPYGYVGLLFPRSSNAKKDLLLSNAVGILDSGYRGTVMFKYKLVENASIPGPDFGEFSIYDIGDRVGQLIVLPYPKVIVKEVDELSSTERGEGGFGSSGK